MSQQVTEHPNSLIEIDVFGLLRRRWSHIALGLFLGILCAALYQFVSTPIYESDIEILVGQRSSELATHGTASSAYASGDLIQEDQLATHMQLITSRRNIGDAIEKKSLTQRGSFREAVEEGTNPIDFLLENLSVERGGEGSAKGAMVIKVHYSDPDPQTAALVLQAVFESYRDFVESHAKGTSGEAAELIKAAGEENERELVQADQDYREFLSNVPILLDGDKVRNVHKDRLEKLETELNEVRSSLAESQSRLEVVDAYVYASSDEMQGMDRLALLSQNEVERLKLFIDMTRSESQSKAFQAAQPVRQEVAKAQYNRLLDLLQKESTLAEDFGPGHPIVEATRQEIDVIEQFIRDNKPVEDIDKMEQLSPEDMLKTYTLLLRNDIAELEKREEVLLKKSNDELAIAKQIENDFLKGNSLKARLERAQDRYNEVKRRLQELDLTGSYAGFSTDLLAYPEIEKEAAWPRFPIILVIGVFLGLFCGLASAVASELIDSSFRDSNDLEKTLHATVIAHIPRFDMRRITPQVEPTSKLSPSLVAFHASRDTEAENYRIARTSLMLKYRTKDLRVWMNTSPHPGDGKSTTLANLAISLAQAGKRVLLIDADMRRPVVSKLFGVPRAPGLTDVVLGEKSIREVTIESEVSGLSIMPHGTHTTEPAELLESVRFRDAIEQCRDQYDLVLIDAPPLLAVADPAIIAPLVDAVTLTVQVKKNGRRPVERAAQILSDVGIQPTALIVNSTSSGNKGTGYYGYSSTYARESYSYVGYYNDEYAAKPQTETPAEV